jgi:uncharacterized protein
MRLPAAAPAETTLDDLRRFAVARTLVRSPSPGAAIERLGYVQADPIRAPARAQDLVLRHRSEGYRAGDLELQYEAAGVEEDFFVNYGFVPRTVQALMQPRGSLASWPPARRKRVEALLAFVRERGTVHPRDVDDHFAHGSVTNYWGGSSNATTQMLEAMHYRGLVRVVRRDNGIRTYGVCPLAPTPADRRERRARIDSLVDVAVRLYAPLPAPCLSSLVARLRYAVPQWLRELRPALARARERLAHARVEGVDWYWPRGEQPAGHAAPGTVRLLAPFDPIVWDRRRFERLWGWAYRFEAYTPAAKRKLGYYALPLLWRDRVIGWANLAIADGVLRASFGYLDGRPPAEREFARELDIELDSMSRFLNLTA